MRTCVLSTFVIARGTFSFFFALYDVRIRSAQLIRNKILREIAGGEKTSNYTFNYPVIIIVI